MRPLTTPRLILNRHLVSDLVESTALWNDSLTLKSLGASPRSRDQVWTKLLFHRGHWDHYGYGCYTVRDKSSGRYLGEIGLKHYMRDMPAPYSDQIPEMAWLLHSDAHGKGYASEALTAIFAEADKTLANGTPTCCLIAPENRASRALAVKFGFAQTDKIRLAVATTDKEVDYYVRPAAGKGRSAKGSV